MTEPHIAGDVVLLRAAALSVREAVAVLDRGDLAADPLVEQGLVVAADSALVAKAGRAGAAQQAALRYVTRMGTRATPFGLFAGTSVVPLGDKTDVMSSGRSRYLGIARVDCGVLETLVTAAADRAPLDVVPVRVNPMLRACGNRYRYLRQDVDPPAMMQVAATSVLAAVVEFCAVRRACGEVVGMICGLNGSSDPGKVRRLVEQLIASGFLVRDIGLVRTGTEPTAVACGHLAELGCDDWADALRDVAADVAEPRPVDEGFLPRLERTWRRIAPLVPDLGEVDRRNRYNVELRMAVSGTIDGAVVADVAHAARMVSGLGEKSAEFAALHAMFERRFGDAAVPVSEVADLELGLAGALSHTGPDRTARGHAGRVQVAALDHWLRYGRPFDLARADVPEQDVPMSVLACLLGDGAGARAVLKEGVVGSPGALAGRFCLGRGRMSAKLRDDIRSASGDGAAVTVELVSNPGGRVGNVLLRPAVTDDQLVLRGGTGSGLDLTRLLVRLEEDGFAFFDKATGRRLVLQLTSAHNSQLAGNDLVYRLLVLMSGRRGFRWTWGQLRHIAHLPRVLCDSVIVSRERWRLHADAIDRILDAPRAAEALASLLPGLGDRRWVGYGSPDLMLPVDLRRDDMVVHTLRRMRGRTVVHVWEMPEIETPGLPGPTGPHVAEICLSLPCGPAAPTDPRPACESVRAEDWVTYKFYCGPASGQIVVAHAAGAARDLVSDGLATRWFFVRYVDDEGYQIRIRVQQSETRNRGRIHASMEHVGQMMRAEGVAAEVVPGIYRPEVTRYGGSSGIELAEELFYRDSEDVVTRKAGLTDDDVLPVVAGDVIRWWGTAVGDSAAVVGTLRRWRARMGHKARWDAKKVGKMYREERPAIDGMLAAGPLDEGVAKVLADLSADVTTRWGAARAEAVIASVVHMHCNRMFTGDSREAELLAYEFAIRKALQLSAAGG